MMLKINNLKITTESFDKVVCRAVKLAVSSKKTNLVQTVNANSFVESHHDALFSKALENADILLPDGFSIALATKLFRFKPILHHRIAGPDFFNAFNKYANEKNMTYFFLGSTDEVLNKIKERMNKEFPNIKVHTLSPPMYPFKSKVNEGIIKKINTAKPNVLWVGMTAPKQEKWTYENRNKLKVPLVASIGAAFDFYAGTRKRAPLVIQKMNLEWLYRFMLEPRRMGKRYINNNIKFIIYMHRIKRKNDK
jgi:N-acetylglucosaminyldiphosphoundecaprenol N-acetyl-beta-D-mannosaminyltransferase